MVENQALLIVLRWMHIFAAVIAVGGSFFMRFILMPAATGALDESAHERLREALRKRWAMAIHICILLFLISGFANYILAVQRGDHDGHGPYHAMVGVKILLAFVVFGMAVALTSSRPWASGARRNARRWLAILVALATVIILISGVLKNYPKSQNAAPLAQPAEATPAIERSTISLPEVRRSSAPARVA